MKYLESFFTSAALGTVLVITGCVGTPGSESQVGLSHYATADASDSAAQGLIVATARHAVHPDTRKSWMKPEAQNERLLYVSDVGTDDVDVYEYKSGSLVGQLTGFDEPQGICTDKAGNIYVANTLASNVLEYAHGGTAPIQTFSDSGQLPVDCTVLPYGFVVVANIATSDGGPGSLSYLTVSGPPDVVTSPWISKAFSIGYLAGEARFSFITVTMNNGKVRYAAMRFSTLHRFRTPVKTPGAVRFSGIHKYMAVGDQSGTVYLVHGRTISTEIKLQGLCAAGQFSITQTNIAVPDPCGAKVSVYAFPKGGVAIHSITASLVQPVGTAVSPDDLRGP